MSGVYPESGFGLAGEARISGQGGPGVRECDEGRPATSSGRMHYKRMPGNSSLRSGAAICRQRPYQAERLIRTIKKEEVDLSDSVQFYGVTISATPIYA